MAQKPYTLEKIGMICFNFVVGRDRFEGNGLRRILLFPLGMLGKLGVHRRTPIGNPFPIFLWCLDYFYFQLIGHVFRSIHGRHAEFKAEWEGNRRKEL
jgi:hypothetical protein